ncbi:roadblock/LC7 domain-containing protein [candidate division KSB1 bacterium]|nr:roadblock/LC7 domain-containing protein [candidate division KSB1 bacterium]
MLKKKAAKDLLTDLIKLAGVQAATVIGRDGFVIDSVSNTDVDLEALGAVVSTGFGAAEIMGNEMVLGGLAQTLMEYDEGKILMAACGEDAILALVTNNNAVIGNLRHNIKKLILDLSHLI